MKRFTVLLAFIVILISAKAFAAADNCTARLELRSDEYYLDLPIVKYTDASSQTHYYYGEFLYVPKGDDQYWFKLTSAGERVDTSSYSSCQPSTLAYSGSALMLHINNLEFNGAYFSIGFEYSPSTDGYTWFVVTSIIDSSLETQNSPFGFEMGAPSDRGKTISGMLDLGSQWIRLSGATGIVWGLVEKTKGQYDWTSADEMISAFSQKGINILVTVGSENQIYQSVRGYLPTDMSAYKAFIAAAAERYDGDGINDAPGSPIVAAWQIENEVDNSALWKDSLENYAKLIKESSMSIKSANSSAKVAIAGMTGSGDSAISKYSQILGNMNDRAYIDVFDFHWHATSGGNYKNQQSQVPGVVLNFDNILGAVKALLANNNQQSAAVWITEMSASDILPAGNTEKTQAIDLVKRYVYPAVKGVRKVFWGTLYEQSSFAGQTGNSNYFNTQALINNPMNDGLSHKKLAYYAYKKTAELLGGSDWNNIQTIQESDGIYIYKFLKNGTPVWVAWNDNPDSRQITIPEVDSSQVKITQAVPNYASGQDVTDYSRAFSTETKAASNTAISVSLGEVPVFVEDLR